MFKKHFVLTLAVISTFVATPVIAGPSVRDMDIRGVKLGMTKDKVQQLLPSSTKGGWDNELVVNEPDASLKIIFTNSGAFKTVVKEVHFCQKFERERLPAFGDPQQDALLEKVKQKYGKPDEEPQKGKLSYGVTSEKEKAAQKTRGYSIVIDGEKVDFEGKDDFVFLRVATGYLRDYSCDSSLRNSSDWGIYLWLRDGPTKLKDTATYFKEKRLAQEQKAKTDAESVKARF